MTEVISAIVTSTIRYILMSQDDEMHGPFANEQKRGPWGYKSVGLLIYTIGKKGQEFYILDRDSCLPVVWVSLISDEKVRRYIYLSK